MLRSKNFKIFLYPYLVKQLFVCFFLWVLILFDFFVEFWRNCLFFFGFSSVNFVWFLFDFPLNFAWFLLVFALYGTQDVFINHHRSISWHEFCPDFDPYCRLKTFMSTNGPTPVNWMILTQCFTVGVNIFCKILKNTFLSGKNIHWRIHCKFGCLYPKKDA